MEAQPSAFAMVSSAVVSVSERANARRAEITVDSELSSVTSPRKIARVRGSATTRTDGVASNNRSMRVASARTPSSGSRATLTHCFGTTGCANAAFASLSKGEATDRARAKQVERMRGVD